MNDGHEDQILDSFLEEMLTNQRPPDLTELIQQRLQAELGPARFQQLKTNGLRPSRVAPKPLGLVRARAGWKAAVAGLVLAAGLMLSMALWRFWPQPGASTQADKSPTTVTGPSPAAPDIPVAPQVAEAPKVKELLPEQLPFSIDSPLPELTQRPHVAAPVAAMNDEEIISWIDERFAKLWESQGLKPVNELDNDQWLDQVANQLGVTVASNAQTPRDLSSKVVRTSGFAESFADRIVSYWLRGTPEADAKHPAHKQLRDYLAQQLVDRKPWNEVLSSLINCQSNEPQSVWLASLAGGGNHRLAGRIGSVMLDEALACAKCHDASDNGKLVSMNQDDYWSLLAIFSGVDAKPMKAADGTPTGRQLVDNQKQLFEDSKLPPVFFERPDGRQQMASYRLPGGDDWRTIEDGHTPRVSLAKWINRSTVTDQASVNLAWRLVFGRPLVAQHAALDGEGYAQRRKILAKLAEQFQAHDRDMGQLVSWLVSSRPFAQSALDIDRSRWLTASEDEIVHWSNATANFAARLPDKPNANVKSLESALASIEKWSGSRDERRATLAQPSPATANKPKTVVKPTANEPMVGYLIHSVKPNYAQSLFINRLVKSQLSWEQQVDHIAGLVGESSGNTRLYSNAKKILNAKKGDKAEALFQLLQGALLCHEAM